MELVQFNFLLQMIAKRDLRLNHSCLRILPLPYYSDPAATVAHETYRIDFEVVMHSVDLRIQKRRLHLGFERVSDYP